MAWTKKEQLKDGGDVWRVRYHVPGGGVRTKSFRNGKAAYVFAADVETDKRRGDYLDPRRGKLTVAQMGERFIAVRSLRPRTEELYSSFQRLHINPSIGMVPVTKLSAEIVNDWYAEMSRTVSASLTAKVYRHLHAILALAVDEERIRRNPCKVKDGGAEPKATRPHVAVHEVLALADVIHPRYRAMVYMGAFVGLRFGEARGLRRKDVNFLLERVSVVEQVQELDSGKMRIGEPKSDAGKRTLIVPSFVMSELVKHCDQYVAADPHARIFTGHRGGLLGKATWRRSWYAAREAIDRPDLHFHDLRHVAERLNAEAGATVKEMMGRMGQSSERAALIYLSWTDERDRAIAAGIDAILREQTDDQDDKGEAASQS